MKSFNHLLLVSSLVLTTACLNQSPQSSQTDASRSGSSNSIVTSISTVAAMKKTMDTPEETQLKAVVCKDPRPTICTREYNPVCATRDTNVRCVTEPCPSTELMSYANHCTACADLDVISYTQGEC